MNTVSRAFSLSIVAVLLAPWSSSVAQPVSQPPTGSVTRALSDSLLDAKTRELSAQLRCPVCQGLALADSPSELSQQMRDVVRGQLAQGKTEDEVKAYFVARYGEWILMAPPARGFNLLVYVLPVVGLLAGAAMLVLLVRRWTRPVAISQRG